MERFMYYVIILATAVTLVFLRGLGVAAVADMCGLIGNSDETRLTARRYRRFYLDVDHPAPCAGNVTSWTVCYYAPNNVAENGIYWAFYAIYRRNVSENGDRYERVSDTFTAVRSEDFINALIVDGGIIGEEFNCYNDTIDNGDSSLTVQAGDVLGACIFDPDDTGNAVRRQLDIIGEVEGESLLEMNDINGCIFMGDDQDIPLSVQRSQLSPRSSRRLHLYAIIAPFPDQETTISTAVTTTVTVASPSDNHEEQSVLDPVAIAAGAVCGGVIILVITISLMVIILKAVCFKNKPVVMETTLSVAECTVNTVATEDNTAYGCLQIDPVISCESTMYETIDLEESTTDEGRRSTEKPLTSVNVAYEEAPVTLSPNVIYNTMEGLKVNTEKDIVTDGNVAYGCSQLNPTESTSITDQKQESSHIVQTSSDQHLTSMIENVAYEETTVHLSPNMAYNTHQFERGTEDEVEYTYVSR